MILGARRALNLKMVKAKQEWARISGQPVRRCILDVQLDGVQPPHQAERNRLCAFPH